MKNRHIQQINTGSMADIAFLLLVFFLVATTMDQDIGIMRKLPHLENTPTQAPVKERNILLVLVNRSNELMVEGEELDISLLCAKTKEFITNKNNVPDLPEVEYNTFHEIGEYPVTRKHVISLRSDRGTSYEMYITVQNELVKAYNELRDELAIKQWNVHYQDLPQTRQDIVDEIYPVKISEAEPN